MSTLAFLAVPIGQLLAAALACGLNLYATVATLALASRYEVFGWTLPIELRGLESGVVIGSAAALYILEFFIDKVPYLDSAWDAIHTVVRPLAAAALVALALDPFPLEMQLVGGVVAGAVAFLAHAAKAGARVIANRQRRAFVNVLLSIGEDVLAVGIALAALVDPTAAIVLAAAMLLSLMLLGPIVWRAAVLGMRALTARIRGFFGRAGWRSRQELPRRLRALVAPPGEGRRPPLAARAGFAPRGTLGMYHNGWLVCDDEHRSFVYHSFLGPRRLELATPRDVRVIPGVLADTLDIDGGERRRYQLFMLKDGPTAERVVSELQAVKS